MKRSVAFFIIILISNKGSKTRNHTGIVPNDIYAITSWQRELADVYDPHLYVDLSLLLPNVVSAGAKEGADAKLNAGGHIGTHQA
jgi:hypothetical protein